MFARPFSENWRQYSTLQIKKKKRHYDHCASHCLISFFLFPSAVDCWNNLPEHLRNSPSVSCFKRILLKTKFPTVEAPLHFLHGSRLLSVIHARLRNDCSDLKRDLFNHYVSTLDKCQICNEMENAEHFFFKCRIYHNHRVYEFTTTRILHPIKHTLLLFGYSRLSLEQTIIIADAVHHYIKSTERLKNNQPPHTIARCNYSLISRSHFLFSVHLCILQFLFVFLENFLYMLYCHVDLIVYYLYRGRAVT